MPRNARYSEAVGLALYTKPHRRHAPARATPFVLSHLGGNEVKVQRLCFRSFESALSAAFDVFYAL
jgi:hypothetical protein